MITQRHGNGRNTIEFQYTEMLVPKDHLLRKINAAIDFSYIYDILKERYCLDNGKPGTDTVVLFKIVLILHMYGIRSMRQTVADIEMNIAYLWFLGYSIQDKTAHIHQHLIGTIIPLKSKHIPTNY